ncbi:hypothetical protein [Pseudomonas syringae]|uniref:hypothetical protein n=1 Tax=Pseudomonas syringae TaxID=317 RepID=UPI0012AEB6A4|nr:hypothetical protein [Pseudomonas syringae]
MNMFTTQSELLPIVIEGQTFKSNAEGLWDLNEAHRELDLPESKSPSEWRNAVATELRASGNLRIIDKVGTLATEAGTIAYAMWVSTDFYLMVVRAFVAMRNDAVLSARMAGIALVEKDALLADNMPKASALMLKADGLGISWTDACRAAGVSQSRLAKDVLVSEKVFRTVWDHDRGNDVIEPSPQQFKSGLFKRAKGLHGNLEGWRVSTKGLNWLTEKSSKINDGVRDLNTKKRLSKRTPAQVSRDFVAQVQRGVYSRNNNEAGGR